MSALSEFWIAYAELSERLDAAKANRYDDPDELQSAMTAMNEFRRYWREIGVAVGERVA